MEMDKKYEEQPQCSKTPTAELIIQKCWVPDCKNIVSFRDDAGWLFCGNHKDRAWQGTIDEYISYESVVKRANEALRDTAIQAQREMLERPGIKELHRSVRAVSMMAKEMIDKDIPTVSSSIVYGELKKALSSFAALKDSVNGKKS